MVSLFRLRPHASEVPTQEINLPRSESVPFLHLSGVKCFPGDGLIGNPFGDALPEYFLRKVRGQPSNGNLQSLVLRFSLRFLLF